MTADANIWCPGGGYRQCGKYSFGTCSLQSPSKDSMQIWPLCKLVTIILHFQFGQKHTPSGLYASGLAAFLCSPKTLLRRKVLKSSITENCGMRN